MIPEIEDLSITGYPLWIKWKLYYLYLTGNDEEKMFAIDRLLRYF